MSAKNNSSKYELKFRPVIQNEQAYKEFFNNYEKITKKPKKFYTISKPKQKGEGSNSGGVRIVSPSQDALERARAEKTREENTTLQIPQHGLIEAHSLTGSGKQNIKKSRPKKRKSINNANSRSRAKRPKIAKRKPTSKKKSSKNKSIKK